jgi:lipopolysaccharide transport system permease protein
MSEIESPAIPAFRRGLPEAVRGSGIVVLLRSVWAHRALVKELARREMTDVHVGQAGGALWVIVHPIVLFAVYAFLFTTVFKVRIGERGPSDYMVYLFAGLAPWLMTQDVLSRATGIMFANSTIVKKVMFPVEALVAKTIFAALKVQGVLFVIVIAYVIIVREEVPWTMALLPVFILLHVVLLWGLALFLSVMAPYFRDLSEFMRIFLVINIYLIPVMYVPNMVPEALRFVLVVNPFSHLIWCYQDLIYFQSIAHPVSWGVVAFISGGAVLLGSYVFIRLRSHLASVV